MSSAEINPVSAVDRLDMLAVNFNTVVHNNHVKISDVYVRSIADPATAFQKRPRFFERIAQWLVRRILHKEASFNLSGVELKVRVYDTNSNVREIRNLFRSALQGITHLKTAPDKERMLRIVQFALNCDQLAQGPGQEESCHKILRDYVMGTTAKALPPNKTIGETLVDYAWPMAKEGKIQLQNLSSLFSVVEETLTEKEKDQVADMAGEVIRQHAKSARDIDELTMMWERDLQTVRDSDLILYSKSIRSGGGAIVDGVEGFVKKGNIDISTVSNLYMSAQRFLREFDRDRFVHAVAGVLQKKMEEASDLNEVVEILERDRATMSAAGISLFREDLDKVCAVVLQRLQQLAKGADDIPKLALLFDAIHKALPGGLQRGFAQITASVINKSVEGLEDPSEILNKWKRGMEMARGSVSQIPFMPADFDPIVLRLAERWEKICSSSMEPLKGVQDFDSFQRVVAEESVRLREMFLLQEEGVNKLIHLCPPELSGRLGGLLKVTMGEALSSLYQAIQQKVLSIVLPDLVKLKTREELSIAATNLHLLKASLQEFSLEAQRDERVRQQNEACVKMIDESLRAIETKLQQQPSPQTPQPAPSTTHMFSHNVITINGVAQAAIVSAIAKYAAPALLGSLGVTGMAATIGLTIAAPTLINIGTSIVTPIGTYIDRQCDKLPDNIKTPMKYAWRVGLTAAAVYVSYAIYRGWSTAAITPENPQPSGVIQRPSGTGQPAVLVSPKPSATMPGPSDVCLPPEIASESVGSAWTPEIQHQYEAAVASGKGQQFLDTLQRSLGFSPRPAPPPSITSTPIPHSQPAIVEALAEKSLFTRIREAFFRGQQKMKTSHQPDVQSGPFLQMVGGASVPSTAPSTTSIPSVGGLSGISSGGQTPVRGFGRHATKL